LSLSTASLPGVPELPDMSWDDGASLARQWLTDELSRTQASRGDGGEGGILIDGVRLGKVRTFAYLHFSIFLRCANMGLVQFNNIQKVKSYQQWMPARWRSFWDNYASLDTMGLLELAQRVLTAVEHGRLSCQEAGAILSPLQGQPAATSWKDGEFVALGVFADHLAEGAGSISSSEQEYLWAEIAACTRRIGSLQQST
jgi:hypothetical protein